MAEEEIEISDLELKEELNGDDLLPVENNLGTFATTLTKIKDWMANFFISERGVRNIISTTLGDIYPIGSVYIGTQTTCPMASKIAGSTWELVAQNRALWGGNGSNANTTIEAGLPNIEGTFSGVGSRYGGVPNTVTGAFYVVNTENKPTEGVTIQNSGDKDDYFGLDASRSSSIYGSSTTVQPPAYIVNVWRRTA